MDLSIQIKEDVKELIDKMTFNFLQDPEVKKTDERFLVSIFVDEPRSLIGERGINLYYLQSVFRRILLKKYGPDIQIDLDINGYKQRRAGFLKELALSARRQVLLEEKALELEYMNAFDRRVVHSSLTDFEDVMTESTGEHPNRRVVVHLAKRYGLLE